MVMNCHSVTHTRRVNLTALNLVPMLVDGQMGILKVLTVFHFLKFFSMKLNETWVMVLRFSFMV